MDKLTNSQIKTLVEMYTTPREDGTFPRQSDLGKIFGIHPSVVSYHIRKAGISGTDRQGSNNAKLSQSDIDRIVKLYTTRNPDGTWTGCTTIALQYNVTDTCIQYRLKKAGLCLRTLKEAIKGKACKPVTNLPPANEIPPLCQCGCGQSVNWNQRKNKWYTYATGHYHTLQLFHNKQRLKQEYVQKKRTITSIAAEFDVSASTVAHAMEKVGMPRRSQAESLRLSGAVRGANNPNWKGGVANWSYSHDWQSLSRRIKNRDNWTCQLCGEPKPRQRCLLHVHHIDGDKTNNHPCNLITLCPSCHHPLHPVAKKRAMAQNLKVIAKRNTDASDDFQDFKVQIDTLD